ncbi:59 protein [uncultured Caudovirales phage]|uniref:59 protein n=1 Tax=uncultured Caudovirales phage TaxID=2100421 RepID=A0A6J5KWZ7_9CAUD|nr:59 protein [uncultured Caudovirales phage]
MITGFKAYKYYMSVKLHFTKDNYNVFETRGNVKGTEQAFLARNDRFIFDRIARKYDTDRNVIQFFVANFAYGNPSVVYSVEEAESNLTEWERRKQSLSKVFQDDLGTILLQAEKDKLNKSQIFEFTSGDMPLILKLFLGKRISIESMYLLNKFEPYLDSWYNSNTLIFKDDMRRILKCEGFVKFDSDKLSKSYNNFIQELEEL